MENLYICKYCGKVCKNKNSLAQHEIRCKENPNRLDMSGENNPFYGHKGKSRFTKAKELGLDKPITEETRKKLSKIWKGRKHSDESKQKIRNTIYKRINEGCKIGFAYHHSSDISYPEQYFIDLFKKENIPLKYHLQVSRYELDFYNKDLMKYVEIDGEQHYSESMIEHDKIRTEFLENLGWTGIRIRWSTYQKCSDDEKREFIKEIKMFLNIPV